MAQRRHLRGIAGSFCAVPATLHRSPVPHRPPLHELLRLVERAGAAGQVRVSLARDASQPLPGDRPDTLADRGERADAGLVEARKQHVGVAP